MKRLLLLLVVIGMMATSCSTSGTKLVTYRVALVGNPETMFNVTSRELPLKEVYYKTGDTVMIDISTYTIPGHITRNSAVIVKVLN